MDFSNTLSEILLQVNGQDRIPKKDGYYYLNIEPYRNHTCGGLIPGDNSQLRGHHFVADNHNNRCE